MKRVGSNGYTIVELLIFLAVSAVLLVSALLMVGGQRNRTEFQNSVRQFESKLTDAINDVATGYYTNEGNIRCNGGTDPVTLIILPTDIGTNASCTFIGKVMQFSPDDGGSDKNTLSIFGVAGRRHKSAGQEVETLSESAPRLIAKESAVSTIPDSLETVSTGSAEVARVYYTVGATQYDVGGIGIFTNFDTSNNPSVSSSSASVAGMSGTGLGTDKYTFVANANASLSSSVINPDGGITICLKSLGTNQHAILTISGKGSLAVEAQILAGSC